MITRKWFIENYSNTDKSLSDIAKMTGRPYSAIRELLHKLGVPPKDKYRGARVQGPKNLKKILEEKGTWNKGLTMDDERVRKAVTNSKITRVLNGSTKGEKHYNWKGDKITYKALHIWVGRHKGKAEVCSLCGSTERVEWANKSKEYKRDLTDYIELCRLCHIKFDLSDSCSNGHKYTADNTYFTKEGWRKCRQCNRDFYHRHKAVV